MGLSLGSGPLRARLVVSSEASTMPACVAWWLGVTEASSWTGTAAGVGVRVRVRVGVGVGLGF